MNLDDLTILSELDSQKMYADIILLPDQLQSAWDSGQKQDIPDSWREIERIVIAGMGGSAIGADLVTEYIKDTCPIPVFIHRDYDLPGWAQGAKTLVVASSHSGNTEESVSAFEKAIENGCHVFVISTGGKLLQRAREEKVPVWIFVHHGQPRAAVGNSFGMLLALFSRLGLIPDPSKEIAHAVATMKSSMKNLVAEIPVVENPAKRLAGQLIGRHITVMGAGTLSVVARRLKCQINELSKAWAQFEYLPEADHNTLAGVFNPEDLLLKMTVIFLRAPSNHPRNQLRTELTRQGFMVEGISTDFIDAKGETPLAHLWSTLHFGDFVSYYLAMAYEVDPTPIPTIQDLKDAMKGE